MQMETNETLQNALERYKNDEISLEEMNRLIEEDKKKFQPPQPVKRKQSIRDFQLEIAEILAERNIDNIFALFKVFLETYPYDIEETALNKVQNIKNVLKQRWESEEFSNIIKLLSSFEGKTDTWNKEKDKYMKSSLIPSSTTTNYNTHGCYVDQLRQKAGYTEEINDNDNDDDLFSYTHQQNDEATEAEADNSNSDDDDDDDIEMMES